MRRFGMPTHRRRTFETWQIIYIDLMTNVMIFFVILWAITQRQESKGISETVGTETVKMLNLPGDVLFSPSKADLTLEGRQVFGRLFAGETGTVLNFDTGGLVKRLLVIHGHTDADGVKDDNFDLGYRRALTAYQEIRKYGGEVPDHVVICSHADNSPSQEVPGFIGTLSLAEQNAVRDAKARNRRITIEDKLVSRAKESAP